MWSVGTDPRQPRRLNDFCLSLYRFTEVTWLGSPRRGWIPILLGRRGLCARGWALFFSAGSSSRSSSTAKSRPSRSSHSGEPSWHRKLRRRRTEGRTTLRTWLQGAPATRREILRAVKALGRHHSQSSLVEQALERLPDTMSGPWRCDCGATCKQTAMFCQACGLRWDQINYAASGAAEPEPWPWDSSWQEAPKSPRARAKGDWRQPWPLARSGRHYSVPILIFEYGENQHNLDRICCSRRIRSTWVSPFG